MTWLLPARGVRGAGAALMVLALVVPAGVIGVRARRLRHSDEVHTLRPAMVRLPAGRFLMGSPDDDPDHQANERQHEVTLSVPFALSVTEVTQAQYERVMGQNPSGFRGSGDRPVENVSFYDAVDYCNGLSREEKLPECYRREGDDVQWPEGLRCRGYRLPTEAEWEYAARAATRSRYAGGDNLDEVAWYGANSDRKTHPVATRAANAWGLYDMTGNVWEWVWDGYKEFDGQPALDPLGPPTWDRRVVRGGSWVLGIPRHLRVSFRDRYGPGNRDGYRGFRLSRSLP